VKISTYIVTTNPLFWQATIEPTIRQAALFSDQIVVVVDEGTRDGTLELLMELGRELGILTVLSWPGHDIDVLGDPDLSARKRSFALTACTGDYCILQDDDECIHEDFVDVIRGLPDSHPGAVGFRFGVKHFYRSFSHFRGSGEVLQGHTTLGGDWYSKKIYMVRNGVGIRHGAVGTDIDNFVLPDGSPLDDQPSVVTVPVEVYHYGWARHDAVLLLKTWYRERFWWGENVWKRRTFPFKLHPIGGLSEFVGTHPRYMLDVVRTRGVGLRLDALELRGGGRPWTVSACILSKNDPQLIGPCVSRLAGHVDEIVVFDFNGDLVSIENARAAAGQTPLVVLRGPLDLIDFAGARNSMQEVASGDYVLHVDCDETFPAEFIYRLHGFLNEYRERGELPLAFRFPRDNERDDRRKPDYQVRLLRREYNRWVGVLHEVPCLVDVPGADEVGFRMLNLVTLDECWIQHQFKEREKTWERLNVEASKIKPRRVGVFSVFHNEGVEVVGSLERLRDLYDESVAVVGPSRLTLDFSLLDRGSANVTFQCLERFVAQGGIQNVQLRQATGTDSRTDGAAWNLLFEATTRQDPWDYVALLPPGYVGGVLGLVRDLELEDLDVLWCQGPIPVVVMRGPFADVMRFSADPNVDPWADLLNRFGAAESTRGLRLKVV
jgi:hypothetical protein